mmetsp:Transcript_44142/g.110013  ORF Transcript_44142/g.110013 Transcript_44142/m.110013 type:complete len:230 (-) Transcript_44142:1139-1828(-)
MPEATSHEHAVDTDLWIDCIEDGDILAHILWHGLGVKKAVAHSDPSCLLVGHDVHDGLVQHCQVSRLCKEDDRPAPTLLHIHHKGVVQRDKRRSWRVEACGAAPDRLIHARQKRRRRGRWRWRWRRRRSDGLRLGRVEQGRCAAEGRTLGRMPAVGDVGAAEGKTKQLDDDLCDSCAIKCGHHQHHNDEPVEEEKRELSRVLQLHRHKGDRHEDETPHKHPRRVPLRPL